MSTLDWVIAAVVGIGIWSGFRAGLVKASVGTIGLVLAFLVATALMEPVGRLVAGWIGITEELVPIVGFVVAFVIVLSALTFVGALFRTALQTIKLGLVESLGGGVIGGAKAAFLLSIFFLASSAAVGSGPWLISEETRASSRLYGAIEPLAPAAWDILTDVAPGIQKAARERFHAAEPFLPGS